MIKNLYTIYDRKAAFYCPPFIESNHETAKRTFLHAASQQGTTYAAHPEDYTLWYIGQFDDHNAKLMQGRRDVVEIATLQGMLDDLNKANPTPLEEIANG